MDLDQDRHSVRPDLGPKCLQRLSAVNKVTASKERVKIQKKKNSVSGDKINCVNVSLINANSTNVQIKIPHKLDCLVTKSLTTQC